MAMVQVLPSRCCSRKPHKEKEVKNESTQELLGVVCQNCWKEWILPRYVQRPVLESQVIRNGQELRRRRGRHRHLMVQSCFAAFTSREEVSPQQAMELLEPGDHIMWRRTYILWHHAIVVGVSGYYIRIIHWSIDDEGQVTVHDRVTNSLEEIGTMYKVIYSQRVQDANPPSLVLARAQALIGTTGYCFLDRQCENFAIYCKTGFNTNVQFHWIVMKIFCQEMTTFFRISKVAPDIIGVHQALGLYQKIMVLVRTGHQMTVARVGAVLLKSVGQYIGAGMVVLVEGVFCAWDIHTMRSNYRTPRASQEGRSLSRNDLVVEITIRSCEAFFGAAATIGAAIGFEILLGAAIGAAFGPAGVVTGVAIGVVVGCVVGGSVGGVIGRAAGNVIGNFVGRAIVATFKTDDRVITINDVAVGDHLVFYKKISHPRCHAIVVGVNRDEGYVEVIRNTYSRGVVKSREMFTRPVYRVTYRSRISVYSKEEIVRRAEAAYEAKNVKYNIFTSNCKHFCYKIAIKMPANRYVQRKFFDGP